MSLLKPLAFAFGLIVLHDIAKANRRNDELVHEEIPDMSMNLDADYLQYPEEVSEQDVDDLQDELGVLDDDMPDQEMHGTELQVEEPTTGFYHLSTRHFRLYDVGGEEVVGPAYLWKMVNRDREHYEPLIDNMQLSPNGGATVVTLYCYEDECTYTGVAVCSRLDPFSRKRGRQIAWGRAVAASKRKTSTIAPTEQRKIGQAALFLSQPNNRGTLLPLGVVA